MTKNIQIRLRSNIAIEKQLMDYIEACGNASGEPRRLLLDGFKRLIGSSDTVVVETKPVETTVTAPVRVPEPEPEPETKEVKKPSFGSLMKKRN